MAGQTRQPVLLIAVGAWAFGVGTGLFFGLSYSTVREARARAETPPRLVRSDPTPFAPPPSVPTPTPSPPGEWVQHSMRRFQHACATLSLEMVRVREQGRSRAVELTFLVTNDSDRETCSIRADELGLRGADGVAILPQAGSLTAPARSIRRVRLSYVVPTASDVVRLVIGTWQPGGATFRPTENAMDIELAQRRP